MSLEDSPRLKIAVLCRGFSYRAGGAENYTISMVQKLSERHEVHVFTQHLDHSYPGIKYHLLRPCVKRPSWIDLLCFSIRTWFATRNGFDVVHSHENIWHGSIQTVHVRPVKVGLFHGRKGWRLYLRFFQAATSPRIWTYLLMERIRFRLSPGKVVIACSDSLRTEIERAYPTLKGKVHLLAPGVHLPTSFNNQEKSEFRNELHLSSTEFVLLFVANDYEKKGLRPLLKALQTLPSNITLLVVGNSAHIAKYSELARQLGVTHQVHFIGSVDAVDRYYNVADALIHPTTEDSFSMVTLEALAHGLPVIVSGPAFCGISSSLKDQVDVLMLQDPRDPSEMAYCVNRLLTDPVLRTELGESGRNFAAKYGWDEIARKQEAIYFRAIEAKRSSNLNP